MVFRCPTCKTTLTKSKYERALHIHEEIKVARDKLKRERAEVAGQVAEQQAKIAALDAQHKKSLGALKVQHEATKAAFKKQALLQARKQVEARAKTDAARLAHERKNLELERTEVAKKVAAQDAKMATLATQHKKALLSLKAEHETAKAAVRKQAIEQARKEFEARTEAGTAQGIGLAHEFVLAEKLRQLFGVKNARVTAMGKNGDVHLIPLVGGREIEESLVAFENKRSAAITAEHLRDAAKAKRKSGAAFVILVTTGATFKRRPFRGLCRDGEILIVAPEAVLPLAYLLHTFLVALSQAGLDKQQRAERSHQLFTYVESIRFRAPIEEIVRDARDDKDELAKEMRQHSTWWQRRSERSDRILRNAEAVKSSVEAIIQTKPIKADLIPLAASGSQNGSLMG